MTFVLRGCRVPANRRVYRKRVRKETRNNRHFDVKLAPEFCDTKPIICITFPDKPGKVSTQIIGRGYYIDDPHNTEIKLRIQESAYDESHVYVVSLLYYVYHYQLIIVINSMSALNRMEKFAV
jgi:hypothetical protein